MITIDGYIIDAAIVEDHAHDNTVTENPTEKGSAMTDHVIVNPDRITYECVVSDTPSLDITAARGLDLNGAAPSEDAYERMKFIRKRATPVTLTDSLGTHTNMMLAQLTFPRRKEDGKALYFRVSFVSMEIVENERTVVRVAVPQQAKRVNRGNKPAKDATAEVPAKKKENTSIFWDLIN